MVELIKKLKVHENIDEFYLSDVDLYGIQTALDEEGIAKMVLASVEEDRMKKIFIALSLHIQWA